MPDQDNEEVIEIRGKVVVLKRGGIAVLQAPLGDLVDSLAREQRRSVFSDGSPIPDQVRYIHIRGNATLVVIELSPQVRRVKWISADSSIRFGDGSRYESVNLAFPFIILMLLFKKDALSGYQQLFYRTRPLVSEQDELLLPNLLNVAKAYGLLSVFCLRKMENVSGLPMGRQIEKVIEHFWEAGFNESMDAHGSYWSQMQAANLDPRIGSVENWRRATEEDPLFMIRIPWQSAGVTLQEVIDEMFLKSGVPGEIKTSSDLITRIYALFSKRSSKRSRHATVLNANLPQ